MHRKIKKIVKSLYITSICLHIFSALLPYPSLYSSKSISLDVVSLITPSLSLRSQEAQTPPVHKSIIK